MQGDTFMYTMFHLVANTSALTQCYLADTWTYFQTYSNMLHSKGKLQRTRQKTQVTQQVSGSTQE